MPSSPIALAARTEKIEPFHVMELMKHAAELEMAGRSIIHMSIGEPDFTAPPAVLAALAEAMASGRAQYTPAVGLKSLRTAISNHYRTRFGASVDPARIIITAGASGALLLTMASIIEAGQEILMPDPSYPCNRHFVSAFDGSAKLIPVSANWSISTGAPAHEVCWWPRHRTRLAPASANKNCWQSSIAASVTMVSLWSMRFTRG
jgi:aspartate/methionine/tyrosine aminotransferase